MQLSKKKHAHKHELLRHFKNTTEATETTLGGVRDLYYYCETSAIVLKTKSNFKNTIKKNCGVILQFPLTKKCEVTGK